MSVSADPPVQVAPFYNLAFFLWMQRAGGTLRAFLRLICLKANLLPWEFSSSVFLPFSTLRACGPLSPGCMHSICIQIIYSEGQNRLIPVWAEKDYLVTHTLLGWGTERGLLTAVLPHTSFCAVYCKPFYPRATGSSPCDELGIS